MFKALSLLQKNLVWAIPIAMTAFGKQGFTIALLIARINHVTRHRKKS